MTILKISVSITVWLIVMLLLVNTLVHRMKYNDPMQEQIDRLCQIQSGLNKDPNYQQPSHVTAKHDGSYWKVEPGIDSIEVLVVSGGGGGGAVCTVKHSKK